MLQDVHRIHINAASLIITQGVNVMMMVIKQSDRLWADMRLSV